MSWARFWGGDLGFCIPNCSSFIAEPWSWRIEWRGVSGFLLRGFDKDQVIHIIFSNDLDQESANGLWGKNDPYIFFFSLKLFLIKMQLIYSAVLVSGT